VKNDQKDARVLSEVSCRIELPSVHVPTELARTLKSLSGSRELLIAMRTKVINNVRGWMRTQLLRLRSGTTTTFATRLRARLTTDQIEMPAHVERELIVIDELNRQLKAADRDLERIAREHPICKLLMTVPGVGPVTAVRFVAAIDSVERFSSAHHVQSYLGLTPGENSSSERQQKTGITKAGPRAVRRTLVQAAWVLLMTRPNEPMARWATQIATRRGRFVAVVALARKLAGVLFAMWRDGTSYRSARAAAPPTP
jgi:transposase